MGYNSPSGCERSTNHAFPRFAKHFCNCATRTAAWKAGTLPPLSGWSLGNRAEGFLTGNNHNHNLGVSGHHVKDCLEQRRKALHRAGWAKDFQTRTHSSPRQPMLHVVNPAWFFQMRRNKHKSTARNTCTKRSPTAIFPKCFPNQMLPNAKEPHRTSGNHWNQ